MNILRMIHTRIQVRRAYRIMRHDAMISLAQMYKNNFILSVSERGSVKVTDKKVKTTIPLISSQILDRDYVLKKRKIGDYYLLRSNSFEHRIYIMFMISHESDCINIDKRTLTANHRMMLSQLLQATVLTHIKEEYYEHVIAKKTFHGYPNKLQLLAVIDNGEITEINGGLDISRDDLTDFLRSELIRKNRLLKLKGDT